MGGLSSSQAARQILKGPSHGHKAPLGMRLHETRDDMLSRSQEHHNWAVHVRDNTVLKGKIDSISRDGMDNLMVMADFDQTVSMYYMPDSMVMLRNQRLFDMGIDQEDITENTPMSADATMKVMFHCDRITEAQIDETK